MRLHRPPSWTAEYVGIPFAPGGATRQGCDCWGLVRLVFRARWRIVLPGFEQGIDPADRGAVAAAFAAAPARGWRRIDPSSAREADVALLRVGGAPCHVGLIVGWPWLLHVERGTDAALDRLDGVRWARRLDSVWRHEEMVP